MSPPFQIILWWNENPNRKIANLPENWKNMTPVGRYLHMANEKSSHNPDFSIIHSLWAWRCWNLLYRFLRYGLRLLPKPWFWSAEWKLTRFSICRYGDIFFPNCRHSCAGSVGCHNWLYQYGCCGESFTIIEDYLCLIFNLGPNFISCVQAVK